MTSEPEIRPPVCATAPVLGSLMPLMGGILVAKSGSLLLATLCGGLLLLWAWRGWSIEIAPPQRLLAAASFLAGLLLLTGSREVVDPIWRLLPPREVVVVMETRETFNARRPERISGIGKILQTDIPHDTISGRLASFYLESKTMPAIGSTFKCRAILTYLPAVNEPDDFQLYLKSRDIGLTLRRGIVLEKLTPPPWHEHLRLTLYHKCEALLTAGCRGPEDPGHVLASMMLGNRSLLSDERVDLYRRTGTYHLFAVSGLHVGSVALSLHWILGLFRLPGAWRLPVILAGTWAYIWLTGSSPSAIRAGIMITCLGASRHLLRQPHLFPALAFSAWLVLLWQPTQLFNLGFQLSYAVVGAIILMGLPLARHLRQLMEAANPGTPAQPAWRRLPRKIALQVADLACVSLSAGLASMPLIIQHFNLFTPAGIAMGILLNPLATITVMAGVITILSGPFAGAALASLPAQATWPAIWLMERLLEGSLKIPGAVAERQWPWPPAGTLVMLTALAVAWLLQRARQSGADIPATTLLLPHGIILASLLFTSVNA